MTHVLVNDPTRGYGILIENMLDGVRVPIPRKDPAQSACVGEKKLAQEKVFTEPFTPLYGGCREKTGQVY